MVTLTLLVVHPLCHKVLTQQCCPGDVQGCASGTCVTAKEHPYTSCPSSRAPLAAKCNSGVMAHEW